MLYLITFELWVMDSLANSLCSFRNMSFKVLYFAAATDFTKSPSESFDAPLSVTELFHKLEEKYPGIKVAVLDSSMLTVNLEYVDLEGDGMKDTVLQPGDEVAIIPPVSSG